MTMQGAVKKLVFYSPVFLFAKFFGKLFDLFS